MIIHRKNFEEIRTGFIRDHFRNDCCVAMVDHTNRVLLTGTGEIDDQDTGVFGITSVRIVCRGFICRLIRQFRSRFVVCSCSLAACFL